MLLVKLWLRVKSKFIKIILKLKFLEKILSKDEKIKIFLTLALIKLLTKMPKEIFRIEFPKVI